MVAIEYKSYKKYIIKSKDGFPVKEIYLPGQGALKIKPLLIMVR
jgi:hypothetical protein